MTRVVGTLTTMPHRYNFLHKTLLSLHSQSYKLDNIYVTVPYISKRLNVPYPDIPPEILSLCTIIRSEDYGPITKIYGGLIRENDPSTVIITFDDDRIYPPELVSSLLENHNRYPNCAIGSAGLIVGTGFPNCSIRLNEDYKLYKFIGMNIPNEGKNVDSIFGYPGALYIRSFFPVKDEIIPNFISYALIDDNMFMNDDIVISGYLSLRNISRKVFKGVPNVHEGTNSSSYDISHNWFKFIKRLNLCIAKSKSIGMFNDSIVISSSMSNIIYIPILFIFVIFCLIILYYVS